MIWQTIITFEFDRDKEKIRRARFIGSDPSEVARKAIARALKAQPHATYINLAMYVAKKPQSAEISEFVS